MYKPTHTHTYTHTHIHIYMHMNSIQVSSHELKSITDFMPEEPFVGAMI